MRGTGASGDLGRRRPIVLAALVVGLVMAAPAVAAAAQRNVVPHISTSAPCGSLRTARPQIRHIILIVEENHSYRQIIGRAPYITKLAGRCGLATRYKALSYPSLPNYIAMTSGRIPAAVAHRDCLPLAGCLTPAPNIFRRVHSWRVYAESMNHPCGRQNAGKYLPRHTAAPYYTVLRRSCLRKDVPLGKIGTGRLATALRRQSLPKFALVVPNATHDMHGGCVACGDRWLHMWMPAIIASRPYQNGHTAVVITWDSDDGCCGNHIPTVVVSPYTKAGTRSRRRFNHYSLLRAIESALHVRYTGAAATTRHRGFAAAFHL
ncbi:MAG: alkaline phosphatase family protein [Actinoallomurus sp.]